MGWEAHRRPPATAGPRCAALAAASLRASRCRFARRAVARSAVRSESQRRADRDHRRASGVHGLDDLAAVDALQIHGSDAEVAVAELALDDDQRDAFAGHL